MTNALKVQRALVDVIARAPAFASRQVAIAHPGQLLEPESVFVQRVNVRENSRALGKAYRREEITVTLALVAEVNADDAQDALDRAYRMFEDVEQVLGTSPSLGLPNILFAQITNWDQQNFAGDGKRAVEITADVTVTANKEVEEN
jgi:hypothetical protein